MIKRTWCFLRECSMQMGLSKFLFIRICKKTAVLLVMIYADPEFWLVIGNDMDELLLHVIGWRRMKNETVLGASQHYFINNLSFERLSLTVLRCKQLCQDHMLICQKSSLKLGSVVQGTKAEKGTRPAEANWRIAWRDQGRQDYLKTEHLVGAHLRDMDKVHRRSATGHRRRKYRSLLTSSAKPDETAETQFPCGVWVGLGKPLAK